MTSSIGVPVCLWDRRPPTHRIIALCLTADNRCVVSGSADGQLVLWGVGEALEVCGECSKHVELTPRFLLVGHTGSIVCLAACAPATNDCGPTFVSSSDSGELFLWDAAEGRCLETSRSAVHTQIQVHSVPSFTPCDTPTRERYLFCCGHYPEVMVLDSTSLLPVCSLASRVEPDWIACFTLVRPPRGHDVILALTMSNVVKMWSLEQRAQPSEALFEDESRQLKRRDALSITFHRDNPRPVLVVGAESFEVYDASDFSVLCSVAVPQRGHRWLGGQFITVDKVAAWCSDGAIYLYQLPRSTVSTDQQAHLRPPAIQPFVYCILTPEQSAAEDELVRAQPPVFTAVRPSGAKASSDVCYIIRGDVRGWLTLWRAPVPTENNIAQLRQLDSSTPHPVQSPLSPPMSLERWWAGLSPLKGIASYIHNALTPTQQLDRRSLDVTASLQILTHSRLAVGLRNGHIVLLPLFDALRQQTLAQSNERKENNDPSHSRVIHLRGGHKRSAVTALLYPYDHVTPPVDDSPPRYDPSILVSGGADFSVIVWDIVRRVKIRSFNHHAGEIQALMVPPDSVNPRILQCVCSLAADHSVALVSLRENRLLLLASKHLFPISEIRWRPADDFLVVQCEDRSVYVWQMETGHLDRILTGIAAEDVLAASAVWMGPHEDDAGEGGEQLANSAKQMMRAIRHKNVAAMKRIAEVAAHTRTDAVSATLDECVGAQPPPLQVQGLRTHVDDGECHLLVFNVEALVYELLREEYAEELSGALDELKNEKTGSSPVLSGLLAKVKDKAERLSPNIKRRANDRSPSACSGSVSPDLARRSVPSLLGDKATQCSVPMAIAQLLLSYMHSWGLEADLDKTCAAVLGLLQPLPGLCFGLISRQGQLALMLPPASARCSPTLHWLISPSLTTYHLISTLSLVNVMMHTTYATFVPGSIDRRRSLRVSCRRNREQPSQDDPQATAIRQAWSLIAALHCVLLPDRLNARGVVFKPCRVDVVVRRWHERCFQIREAAQALMLAELKRLGVQGRRALISAWCQHLPTLVDASLSLYSTTAKRSASAASGSQHALNNHADAAQLTPSDLPADIAAFRTTLSQRNQATAVILLSIVGAQFPSEIIVENDHNIAAAIARSLVELLTHPPTVLLQPHSRLRRAGIDCLGRGFAVWQPYLDISRVLLALLDLCTASSSHDPPRPVFPLSPQADTSRTARQALMQIAAARPAAFITALSKEVARFNQLSHQQAVQPDSPLVRTKTLILRIVEQLAVKHHTEVVDLMVPMGEILVFALDQNALRQRTLVDVFPPMAQFTMVSYCSGSRRLAFGGKTGQLVVHELQFNKSQSLQAHGAAVTACTFSEDGRYIATYCADEGRLVLWQTSQSFLGMGQSSVKQVKQVSAPHTSQLPANGAVEQKFTNSTTSAPHTSQASSPTGSAVRAKLVWISSRAVTLMLPSGQEYRFPLL